MPRFLKPWPFVGVFALSLLLPPLAPGAAHAQVDPVSAGARFKQTLKQRTRKGAAGVNDLFALVRDGHGEVSPELLVSILREVAKDTRVIEPLRDWAQYQAIIQEQRQGRGSRAASNQALGALGYLTQAQVLGPFADASKTSLEQALAPELSQDPPAQGYLGKVRKTRLHWRPLTEVGVLNGAYIALDDLLYPNTDALAYVRTWVRVPGLKEAQKVSLHIGSGGAYRVWANRTQQGQGGADRRPHPLQDEIEIELAPGWNELLIKGNVKEGLWGYYLRLTDLQGKRIPGLEQRGEAPTKAQAQASPAGRLKLAKRGQGGLARRLKARAERGRSTDLAALFEFYKHTDPFDQNDPTLEELAERIDKARPTAHSAYTWARVTRGQGPKGERLALTLKRKNSARDPESTAHTHARAHAALALRKQELGQPRAFREHMDKATELWPEHWGFALMSIRALQRLGWDRSALVRLKTLAKSFPGSTMVQNALSRALAEQGQFEAAFAQLEGLRQVYGPLSSVNQTLVDLRLDHGDQAKALELRREAVKYGARPLQLVQLARLEEASGNQLAAIQRMDQALEASPHQDEYHRERAEMLLRMGQKKSAIRGFERSLTLRPQQPDLRDLLAALGAQDTKDFFGSEGLSLSGVASKIKKAKREFPKADSVLLEQKQVISVLSNGLRESLDHRQIYIANRRGVKAQENQGTVYDPALSFVEVKRARVRHADGRVEELGNADTYSMTAAGYRMYYDQRQLVVHFPGLKPGDVIDVAFLRRDIAEENYFGNYFGDLRPLRQSSAQLKSEVIYEAPKSRTLFFNRKVHKEDRGKTMRYRVSGPKVGPLLAQDNMPGWTDSLEYVHVSSYERWNQVADWYWDLVREQLVSDDAIRGAVETILKELGPSATLQDKVAALYHHVVQKTRYVGLEFGIHGYKPYRTTQIYERRFGDCKDKASLLKVMLDLAGIESFLVLVRTKDQGRLTDTPASLSAFNHAILYVPALDRFLDGTAEFSGFGELPSADHGASVLIVKDGKGGEFRQIPDETPQDNLLQEQFDLQLGSDGSASGTLSMGVQGNLLSAYRRLFEDATTQSQALQRQLNPRYRGVKVQSMQPITVSLQRPIEVKAKIEIPRVVDRDDKRSRSLLLMGKESALTALRTKSDQRRHPFARRSAMRVSRQFSYRLPKGARWVQVPKSQTLQSAFGELKLQVQTQADRATVDLTLNLQSGVLSVKEFARYREFLQSVDRLLNQRLRFEVKG